MKGRLNPHLPIFTKHRKGKGQFKRKKKKEPNKIIVSKGKTIVIN
tara:strand:- start:697 stop:831 length:135 start_codon:yes stop_codon:yes gene_type:complete